MSKVYLIEAGGRGLHKIGRTRGSARKRAEQLQTGSAEELRVMAEFESVRPGLLEKTLHRHFGQRAVRGEWFALGERALEEFLAAAAMYERNFEVLVQMGNRYIK